MTEFDAKTFRQPRVDRLDESIDCTIKIMAERPYKENKGNGV